MQIYSKNFFYICREQKATFSYRFAVIINKILHGVTFLPRVGQALSSWICIYSQQRSMVPKSFFRISLMFEIIFLWLIFLSECLYINHRFTFCVCYCESQINIHLCRKLWNAILCKILSDLTKSIRKYML